MTKDRLRNYLNLQREAEQVRARLQAARDMRGSLRSPDMSGMPRSSGVHSAVEDQACQLLALEGQYSSMLTRLTLEQLAIEQAVERLPESVDRQLLRCRYLQGMKWEEVCLAIGYSWQQTHRIHARALESIKNT